MGESLTSVHWSACCHVGPGVLTALFSRQASLYVFPLFALATPLAHLSSISPQLSSTPEETAAAAEFVSALASLKAAGEHPLALTRFGLACTRHLARTCILRPTRKLNL